MARNRGHWLLAIYLFLAVYLLPMFPHGGSANELTRWATAASLIEKSSFDITWTEPLIGSNVDTAKLGNSTYSNKAPGPAIIAAPVYGLVRLFVGPPDASNIRISWFAMRFVLSTLPLLLLGLWLYRRDADELSLATLLFATPLFLYSLLFFSHVFVAVVIYLAFRVIYDKQLIRPEDCFYAGLLCGLAVISEFPAVFVVAVFGAGLLLGEKRDRSRNLLAYAAGGLPSLIFLLVYNNSLFGSPFSFSYAHESFPEWAAVAGQGVLGIGFPTLSNAYLLLLSPSRGLLFTAPILIAALFTIAKIKRPVPLREKIRVAAIVITFVVLCGHGAAHGGWAFGPRYLVLLIPLILDPFFDGESYSMSNVGLGFAFPGSLFLCALPAMTFPFAPPEYAFPHNNFWAAVVAEEGWAVPNLAAVFGLQNTLWTLLPAVAALALALVIVWRSVRRPERFLVGFAMIVPMLGVYVALPFWRSDPDLALRRATIAERFYKPADRLQSFKLNARDDAALRKIADYEWMIADARAFAPDDFPYLAGRDISLSPSAAMRAAAAASAKGRNDEAVSLLEQARESLVFARCELTANLAVILYSSGDKERALTELEAIKDSVSPASRPGCVRSLFLLGSLYQELSRDTDAQAVFTRFMSNSANTEDPELLDLRRRLPQK